jgi:hypothetical protein
LVHASDFSRAFSNREHGWRAVTLLKTFLDETGIHHDAEMVAVAGYIGRPKHVGNDVGRGRMISRTPTLAEWPYRMVRLACDLCPRRGQYAKTR